MSLYIVQDLLAKHRLEESSLARQEIPHHAPAENMVHKRYLAELGSYLARLDSAEIAEILEALSADDLLLVWGEIDESRLDDLLDEVSDATRDILASRSNYLGAACVVNAFELAQGRLRQTTIESVEDLEGIRPIWVDLVGTTKADRRKIGHYFGLEFPDPEELTDIESSARFYVEEQGDIHLHSDFLLDKEGESRNVPVAFILFRDILFSVREEELPVFRLQRLRARILAGSVTDGMDMLLDLYAADVEYSADALEESYIALGEVGKKVLSESMSDEDAGKVLSSIAEEEDLNGRIRRNVLDTRRALTFLIRRRLLSSAQLEDAQQILRDIESLDGHTAFLFDKINFLMDATVGMININQNKIIKIFSVASVALLPPTLIASIYGMNFKYLPELGWVWGYPFSLSLMVISVAIPFVFFYRKGWLR